MWSGEPVKVPFTVPARVTLRRVEQSALAQGKPNIPPCTHYFHAPRLLFLRWKRRLKLYLIAVIRKTLQFATNGKVSVKSANLIFSFQLSMTLLIYFAQVCLFCFEELDGPAVSALWRAIAEVKQRWTVMVWVNKNLLFQAPPCFGSNVKPLVPAAFAVVCTHQPALGPRGGLWPAFLCVIHKEGLCPSSGDINRLMKTRVLCAKNAFALSTTTRTTLANACFVWNH
jgi:hypothetical protein